MTIVKKPQEEKKEKVTFDARENVKKNIDEYCKMLGWKNSKEEVSIIINDLLSYAFKSDKDFQKYLKASIETINKD